MDFALKPISPGVRMELGYGVRFLASDCLNLFSFSENSCSGLCERENCTRWTKSLGIPKTHHVFFVDSSSTVT